LQNVELFSYTDYLFV